MRPDLSSHTDPAQPGSPLGALLNARLLGAACAAVLLVTACSAEGGNPTGPSPTSTSASTVAAPATTTPTPGATSPTNPGAESQSRAIVEKYLALYSSGMTSGDGSPLLTVSTPECKSCRSAADAITDLVADGARASGGEVVIREARVRGTATAERVVWEVSFDQSASTTTARDGTTTTLAAASSGTFYVETLNQNGQWLVNAISASIDAS